MERPLNQNNDRPYFRKNPFLKIRINNPEVCKVLLFVIGLFIGAAVGVTVAGLMLAVSEEDDHRVRKGK